MAHPLKHRLHAGEQFGRWTLMYPSERAWHWVCRCECGGSADVSKYALKSGASVSCGCVRRERHTTHGQSARGHRTGTYSAWHGMLSRCTNPNHIAYRLYGARGVSVCARWRKFAAFYEDMGARPRGCTLDRIDNARGYEPGNCRWATAAEQARNTRRNNWLTLNGERLTLTDWCNRYGVNTGTVRARLRFGWSHEEALTTPPNMRTR